MKIEIMVAGIGLLGVTIGGIISWLILRQQQKNTFSEKQLKEFYGPLLAIRLQIQTISNLRLKVMRASEDAWQEKCLELAPGEKPDFAPYKKLIDHYDNQYGAVIRPLYRHMQKVFLDNSWLAEPETLEFFNKLNHYNESQDLILTKIIPPEVYFLIELKEEELKSFYDHLSDITERLKRKMK